MGGEGADADDGDEFVDELLVDDGDLAARRPAAFLHPVHVRPRRLLCQPRRVAVALPVEVVLRRHAHVCTHPTSIRPRTGAEAQTCCGIVVNVRLPQPPVCRQPRFPITRSLCERVRTGLGSVAAAVAVAVLLTVAVPPTFQLLLGPAVAFVQLQAWPVPHSWGQFGEGRGRGGRNRRVGIR